MFSVPLALITGIKTSLGFCGQQVLGRSFTPFLEQNVRQALQILARGDLIHSEVEFQAQKHAETIFEYLILDFIENAFGIFFASSPLDGVCQETV